ncbi:hypothetical protein LFL97_25820 [Burkholderia sp. JSH-S8]|nr:hypothetical protein LFL97_25820 [Burkholderia sp. JSH-S8]
MITKNEKNRADALTDRDQIKTNAEQGLYRKFDVRRVDGSDQPGGKHHDCEYFVLDIAHDQHARAALHAYASACVSTHPDLSADLIARYALAPVDQPAPLTAQAALAAIETFEIVGENNGSREPNSDDRFILTEYVAHLFGGYPVEQPAPAPIDEPSMEDAIRFSGDSLTLSGAQLLEALDFIAPDRDADQLESELTFQRGNGNAGNGMYCWLTEYAEEGAILLDGSTVQPVAADVAEAPDQQAAMEAAWTKHTGEPWHGGNGLTRSLWEEAWQQAAGWMESRESVPTPTMAAAARTLAIEDVRTARETARQLFEGECNHAFAAIEYFAQLLEATDAARLHESSRAGDAK